MKRLFYYSLALLALVLPGTAMAQEEDPPRDERPRRERDRDRDKDPGRDRDDCRCGLREVSDHPGSRRSGFWLSGGLGAGSESFNGNDGLGWSDDTGGGVAFLKLGGTVSRSFLVGVEGNVWGARYYGPNYDRSLASLMVVGQWYPAPATGFWLRGGLGWARDDLEVYSGSSRVTSHLNGTAFAVGLGYDIPVGRKVSITPLLDFQAQRYRDHDERIVAFGLGITLH